MIKRYTIRTILLLISSWLVPHIHRFYNNRPIEIIHPFLFSKDKEISIQWYVKDVGDLLSFSLLMLTVWLVLRPIIKHLKDEKWVGHNALLIFATVWQRLFLVIFVASVFDLIHYIIAFRQLEWYFLILNGAYFIMSFYYILKLWRR